MHAEFSATEIHQKEQLARFLWTGFILMFFAVQAVIWTIAILMTSNDSSHAVVRDFEAKKALPPSRAARAEANRVLGWTASLKVRSDSNKQMGSNRTNNGYVENNRARTQGQAEVELTLTDQNGSPIEVPYIELTAFHCARAAEVLLLKLSPQQPGIYRGTMQLNRSGQWQFDGNIQRDKKTFFFSERLSL
jgi:nitrogen fixation protein FixH